MTTAEELVVAITSTGVSETRQDLEGVEKQMEETAAGAGDAAEQLEGFSERFAGAMSTAVAALAIGISGLASQIPVVGELFAGFGAILNALFYQVDQLLRPALSGITPILYDVANGIFNAKGAVGDLVGVLTIVGTAIGSVIAGLVAWSVAAQGFIATAVSIGSVLSTVGSAILGVASALAGLITLPALIVAAIVAFAAAYATNMFGVRDKTNRILGQIWGFFTGLAAGLVSWATGLASKAWTWGTNLAGNLLDAITQIGNDIVDWFFNLGGRLVSWASGLAGDAYDWGVSIIQGLLNGILEFASDVVKAMQNVVNRMIDVINATIEKLPSEVKSRLDISKFGSVTFDTSFADSASGGSGGSGGNPSPGPGRGGSRFRDRGMTLDGRQLSESTGRYRSDPGRRRGL